MHAYLSGNMRRDVYVHVVCTISCRPLVKVCVYVCVWTDAARVMPALHLMDLRACDGIVGELNIGEESFMSCVKDVQRVWN